MSRTERRSASDFSLKWRPYRRGFVSPVSIRGSELAEREGLLLRLRDEVSGAHGFGECAPLPQFGSESLETATRFLESAFPGGQPGADLSMLLEVAPAAVGFAIESALHAASNPPKPGVRPCTVKTAALLTLGPQSGSEIARLRSNGFRTFKLKVGRSGAKQECTWLQKLVEGLKPAERLRIDPNQSWTIADAMIWRETLQLAAGWIDFVEEPYAPSEVPGHHLRQYAALDVPIALDESLQGGADTISRWVEAGWDGWWVVKPSLLGPSAPWQELLQPQRNRVVISSAYESAIGMSRLIELAASFGKIDHGLGTQAAFADEWGCPQKGAGISASGPDGSEKLWKHFGGD